jgi:nucleoside-diphosphate-sugar epimerase
MNAAILGCGYVGRAVASAWQENSDLNVTVTTTTAEKIPQLEAIADRAIVWKSPDREGLKSILRNCNTVLLSIGARYASYADTYLQAAESLTSILAEMPHIKQVIYTGSYAVYGDRQGEEVVESSPLMPATENGEALAKTEQVLLSAMTENCRVCLFRLGGIYGPDRELVKIFSRAAGTTRAGTGNEITNWIHLDDIVGAIEFARQHQLSGIYNLVDGAHLTGRELLDRIMDKHNLPRVTWDASQPSLRAYNAKVSDRKLAQAGYQLKYPDLCDRDV